MTRQFLTLRRTVTSHMVRGWAKVDPTARKESAQVAAPPARGDVPASVKSPFSPQS